MRFIYGLVFVIAATFVALFTLAAIALALTGVVAVIIGCPVALGAVTHATTPMVGEWLAAGAGVAAAGGIAFGTLATLLIGGRLLEGLTDAAGTTASWAAERFVAATAAKVAAKAASAEQVDLPLPKRNVRVAASGPQASLEQAAQA